MSGKGSASRQFHEAAKGQVGMRPRRENPLVQAEADAQAAAESSAGAKQGAKRLHEDEPLEDDVQLYDLESGDEEGAEPYVSDGKKAVHSVTKPRKARATGSVAKNPDMLVIDPYGVNVTASDKIVKINLAKFLMIRVTEENPKDSKYKGCSTDHFECLVPLSDPKHKLFSKVYLFCLSFFCFLSSLVNSVFRLVIKREI